MEDAEDLDIPLRGMWNHYHKYVPDKSTPNPSQTLGWNPNGQDEDTNRHGHDTEEEGDPKEIGKDTQESLEAIDEITGKMKMRREKERKEEEEKANKLREELEDSVRRQKEGLEAEGAKIWGGIKNPSVYSPFPSPCMTPIDPKVLRNRFGTVSPPPNRPEAPKMSPGGRYMGEGSQRVSLIPMDDVEFTLERKHAKAGSKLFTLPPRYAPPPPAVPSYPRDHFPIQQGASVPPSIPEPQASSSGSSISVVETVPQKTRGPQSKYPVQVLGEKYVTTTPTTGTATTTTTMATTDAEGDTPMQNATSLGPVTPVKNGGIEGKQENPIDLSTPTSPPAAKPPTQIGRAHV